jgi:glycosyltransferase involved in cell wall biosynthesis
MIDQIVSLSCMNDVTVVTSGGKELLSTKITSVVNFKSINFSRKIQLINDLKCMIELMLFFKQENFDIIHSIMPKTGLLSMIAAKITGVSLRFHTFTGQVWATKSGISLHILKNLDRLIAASSSHLLTDSPSQKDFLIEQKITNPLKISVLAEGSISGVDENRFYFDASSRNSTRAQFNIKENDVLFLFLGRLNKDKGILDLISAFELIADEIESAHLLIVGPDESNMEMVIESLSLRLPSKIHRVGFTNTPEKYMSASDVFCLPSYREGFGSVIIEAAAVGIPAIASRIYGITDAVDDRVTGILHPPGDIESIAESIRYMAMDPIKRISMGVLAKERALEKFSQSRLTKAFIDFYSVHN